MNLPAHIQARLRVPDIPAYAPAPRWDTGCRHVILVVLDGVGRGLFDSVPLSNLDALRSRGADFSHCLTTTPTITGSAHTSIHSGSYPETHRYGFPFWVKDKALIRPAAPPASAARSPAFGWRDLCRGTRRVLER